MQPVGCCVSCEVNECVGVSSCSYYQRTVLALLARDMHQHIAIVSAIVRGNGKVHRRLGSCQWRGDQIEVRGNGHTRGVCFLRPRQERLLPEHSPPQVGQQGAHRLGVVKQPRLLQRLQTHLRLRGAVKIANLRKLSGLGDPICMRLRKNRYSKTIIDLLNSPEQNGFVDSSPES